MNAQLPPGMAMPMPGAPPAAAPPAAAYKGYLRWGFLAILILVLGVFGWSAFAKIKGAVLATGYIAVEGKAKVIQHFEGGIVGEILVKDGMLVSAGDVLIRLDPTQVAVNEEIVSVQLNETLARVYRLQAERDGLYTIKFPPELLEAASLPRVAVAIKGQENLFDARRTAMRGQKSQLSERISQVGQQINGLNALIGSKNQQLSKIKQEAAGKRSLYEKGYLGLPAVLALEREQFRLDGDIANHRADIARLQGSISETRQQISQISKDLQAEVLTELRQAEAEASGFREQLTAASAQSKRIDIVSPVDGVVHNLQMTTLGGVIPAGEQIMQIIPSGARLIIEAQVQPQDIDQVYEGQPTTVRLSAFNARRTPEMNGSVIAVAPDRIIDQVTGMPYYTVKIEIPPEELGRLDSNLTLIPGMPAESFMQTESRSVLSYIMKPATDAMRRAGREE